MEATDPHAVEIQSHAGESLFRIETHGHMLNVGMHWSDAWQWVTLTPDQAFGLADQILKVAKSLD